MKALAILLLALSVLSVGISPAAGADTFGRSLCKIHYPSDDRIPWHCVKLKSGNPEKLFGEYWEDVLRFNRLDRRHFVAGRRIKVPDRLEDIRMFNPLPVFLPEAANEEKFILVDQSEMFLGAYAYGRIVLAAPAAVGMKGHRVPNGEFRIQAVDRLHASDTYKIEGEDDKYYPMHYGMMFLIDNLYWVSYWIHGRDVPGVPASHGCVGLYDEEMQTSYYKTPKSPVLNDARKLYRWVVGDHEDSENFRRINYGPRLLVIGTPPQ